MRVAEAGDCVLTLLPALGEFVPAGAPLFESSGETKRVDVNAAIRSIGSASSVLSIKTWLTACECSSISPSAHCRTDRSSIRRRLCRPSIGCMTACVSSHRDLFPMVTSRQERQGAPRDPSMTWEDYVHLAFDEIRMAGAGSPQVARRLRAALEDLLTVAPQERKRALQEQLDLLQSGMKNNDSEASDRALFVARRSHRTWLTVPRLELQEATSSFL